MLTIKDVIKKFSIKESHIRSLIRYQNIPYLRLGRSIMFDEKDLDKWWESLKVQTAN